MTVGRRRYVAAYDIADPKRLRRVYTKMRSYGYPLQYSLFVCDLEGAELAQLRWDLTELINNREDRVVLIDLGNAPSCARFEFLGVRSDLPTGGAMIV